MEIGPQVLAIQWVWWTIKVGGRMSPHLPVACAKENANWIGWFIPSFYPLFRLCFSKGFQRRTSSPKFGQVLHQIGMDHRCPRLQVVHACQLDDWQDGQFHCWRCQWRNVRIRPCHLSRSCNCWWQIPKIGILSAQKSPKLSHFAGWCTKFEYMSAIAKPLYIDSWKRPWSEIASILAQR